MEFSALGIVRRVAGVLTADTAFSDPRLAAVYDPSEGHRDDLSHYESIVDELAARSVLDIGCGTGELVCRLAIRGIEVTGLDPAAASLALAAVKPAADRVRWVHGDATALARLETPVRVDLATMTGNVAQVFLTDDDWSETLGALARCIHPGGHLVFETRNPARRDWEERTEAASRGTVTMPDGERVDTWVDVTAVRGEFVTFDAVYVFESDGRRLTSESTLRFRSRAAIERSLVSAGFEIADVRDAPDRPGKEFVFVGRR